MRKSKSRLALEEALAEATTPESKADIAFKLSRVIEAEIRERGRKRRARAKRLKEAPPPSPRDDGDDPFDFEPTQPSPPILTTPTPEPPKEERKTAEVVSKPEEPAPAIPDGESRVIDAFAFPSPNDPIPRSTVGPMPGEQWSPFVDDAIESNAYCPADGWSYMKRDPKTGKLRQTNQRLERERREREREEAEWMDKLWGK